MYPLDDLYMALYPSVAFPDIPMAHLYPPVDLCTPYTPLWTYVPPRCPLHGLVYLPAAVTPSLHRDSAPVQEG